MAYSVLKRRILMALLPTGALAGAVVACSSGGDENDPWQKQCMSPQEAWTSAHRDAGSDAACPTSFGMCTDHRNGRLENGECCYDYRSPSASWCGRPFVVDGARVVAPVIARADWQSEIDDVELTLDADTRAELAAAWQRDAALEHASIASFARFVMQLLGLGAPSELVTAAERALGDEIEHARLCFALASRYAGRDLGPGPLAGTGASLASSLAEIAVATVYEGCIGETLSALIASEQLARAEDAMVRRALERIASDEAAHSELAWRFVAWAIRAGGPSVAHAVAHAFEHATSKHVNAHEALRGELRALHAHGRLSLEEIEACENKALDDVIAPCARALSSELRYLPASPLAPASDAAAG